MFKRFGIKHKIMAGILGIAVLFSAILSIQYYQTRKFVKFYQHIVNANLNNIGTMVTISLDYGAITQDVLEITNNHVSAEQRLTFQKELGTKIKDLTDAVSKFELSEASAEEKNIVDEFKKTWQATAELVSVLAVQDRALNETEIEAFKKEKFLKTDEEISNAIEKLDAFEKKEADHWEEMAKQAETNSVNIVIALSFASVLVNILFAIFFGRSIAKSIMNVISTLDKTAKQTNEESKYLSEASSKLSESSTEEAAALQETAAAIDEVTAMVKKNTESSAQSANVSKQSRTAAANGKQAVNDVLIAIEQINQSNAHVVAEVEKGNRDIEQIVRVIEEIGQKTKVINDIVFQTKLLSFNASVEAARAGEHGKGFAVVAEEVGNLAQMSGNAAKEISTLLDASLRNVEAIVAGTKERVERMMNEGREKITAGQDCANRAGESISQILTSVENVDEKVSEITSASKEQSQGISEINKAINELDKATQFNSRLAIDAASSAGRLQQQSEKLEEIVVDLKDLVLGSSSTLQAHSETSSKPHQNSSTPAQKTEHVAAKPKVSHQAKPVAKSPVPTNAVAQTATPAVAQSTTRKLTPSNSFKGMPVQSTVTKKAAGAELLSGTPLHSDPRFEEI